MFTLFHELRHWYQQKHITAFHKFHSSTYNNDVSMDNYEKQTLEVDANKFAKKYAEKIGVRFIKVKGIDYISANRSKLKR